MFRLKRKPHFTLGLYQAASGLFGALVRREDGEPTLLRVFGANEQSAKFDVGPIASISRSFAPAFGGDGAGYEDDSASSGRDIFLTSEFGPIPIMEPTLPPDTAATDLRAILARCREEGAENLEVVWCLGTPHFSWTEVRAKDSGRKINRKRPAQDAPSVLIPMAFKQDVQPRFLSFYPRPDEPASAAVSEIRRPAAEYSHCILDSEVSALLALVLTALQKQAIETESQATLVARIGEEDVLVLVLHGRAVEKVEILRSLSVHDGPDMICSRILLLQDEFGLGDFDRVLVAAPVDDERFVDSFQSYFGRAGVSSLGHEMEWLSPGNIMEFEALPAVGAALRDILALTGDDNLLPEALRRPPRSIPYSWEVWTLLALLAVSTTFFAARYLHHDSEISARHARIEALTHDSENADLLRRRIDSLQIAYSVNTNGLEVLDSLLVGSDRWSRTFDRLTVEMNAIGDVWIEKWQPAGSIVDVTGRAGSRDRVVELARRLAGTIEEISYPNAENDLYSFRMKAPVVEALPEAAVFLRERAAQEMGQSVPGPLHTL